jgi:hypothetical protein
VSTRRGRIIVGVTDAVIGGLSFAELQELFSNAKWQLDTPDLLNLDGGGSAQLYVKSGKIRRVRRRHSRSAGGDWFLHQSKLI